MIHHPRSVTFTLCMEGLVITTATMLVKRLGFSVKTAFHLPPSLPHWTILGGRGSKSVTNILQLNDSNIAQVERRRDLCKAILLVSRIFHLKKARTSVPNPFGQDSSCIT